MGDDLGTVAPVERRMGPGVRFWSGLDPDVRTFALGYLVLLPLFLMPVFVTQFLPGLDLPFHLSIADMLMKADDPSSPYAPYYESRLGFAPYAAHYLLLVGLGRFMTLAHAHNVVMGIYIAVLPLCCSYLLAVSGKSRLPALLAFPLCFNMTLHYGFISFCLSLPALLLWIALIADLLTRPSLGSGWRVARLPVLASLAGCLLYLCHLQNYLFGICAIGVVCVLGPGGWRRRAIGVAAIIPSALSLMVWWRSSPFTGDGAARHGSFDFAWETLKNARMADLQWGNLPLRTDIENRIGWFPDHLLKGFVDLIDVRVANAILFAAAFYYLLGWLGAWMGSGQKRRTQFRLAHTMVFFGALFAYFALPHHLREFELMTFYPRFSVLAVLLFLPLIPAGLGRISGFMRVGVVLPAILIGVLWSQSLFIHYRLPGRNRRFRGGPASNTGAGQSGRTYLQPSLHRFAQRIGTGGFDRISRGSPNVDDQHGPACVLRDATHPMRGETKLAEAVSPGPVVGSALRLGRAHRGFRRYLCSFVAV